MDSTRGTTHSLDPDRLCQLRTSEIFLFLIDYMLGCVRARHAPTLLAFGVHNPFLDFAHYPTLFMFFQWIFSYIGSCPEEETCILNDNLSIKIKGKMHSCDRNQTIISSLKYIYTLHIKYVFGDIIFISPNTY